MVEICDFEGGADNAALVFSSLAVCTVSEHETMFGESEKRVSLLTRFSVTSCFVGGGSIEFTSEKKMVGRGA